MVKLDNMKNDLKVGDVVKLRSGGPDMTVTEVHDSIIDVCYYNKITGEFVLWQEFDHRAFILMQEKIDMTLLSKPHPDPMQENTMDYLDRI